MRNAESILEHARCDITNTNYRDVAHLWLEFRKLEALLDIRDLHEELLIQLKLFILKNPDK